MNNHSVSQGASTRTLIAPPLFAVNIVGLSLFQHTALMKYDPASSSFSFDSEELNLWHAMGLEIACNQTLELELQKKRLYYKILCHLLNKFWFLWPYDRQILHLSRCHKKCIHYSLLGQWNSFRSCGLDTCKAASGMMKARKWWVKMTAITIEWRMGSKLVSDLKRRIKNRQLAEDEWHNSQVNYHLHPTSAMCCQ